MVGLIARKAITHRSARDPNHCHRAWCGCAGAQRCGRVSSPRMPRSRGDGDDRGAPAAASRTAGPPKTSTATPPTTGRITGTVEAPDLDAPLAGATVTIVGTPRRPRPPTTRATTSSTSRPGTCKLRAEFAGFKHRGARRSRSTAGASVELDFELATVPLLNETIVVVGSRTPRTNVDSPVAGRRRHRRGDRAQRPHRDRPHPRTARAVVHLDAADDRRRQRSRRSREPARPRPRPGARARQRQAPPPQRAAARQRHVRPRHRRHRSQRDPGRLDQADRDPARRRGRRSTAPTRSPASSTSSPRTRPTCSTSSTRPASPRRATARSSRRRANYGFKVGEKGFLNVTGEFLQREATNRAGAYTGTVYTRRPRDGRPDARARRAHARRLRDEDRRGRRDDGHGRVQPRAAVRRRRAVLQLRRRLAPPRRGRPASIGSRSRTRRTSPSSIPNGFLPEIHPTIDDTSITVGMRRKGDVERRREPDARRERVPVRHRELGQRVARHVEPDDVRRRHAARRRETVANLDLLHKLDIRTRQVARRSCSAASCASRTTRSTRGDEASYALGNATYGTPPQPKLPGAQVFPGFQPSNEVDRTRDNVGVYAGVESELNKDLALDLGGRFENYSDFGQLADRQGRGAREARRRAVAARRREHRLPRAVAAAAVVLERVDAVPARRDRRAAADAGADEQQRRAR